ncbi:hypothetical protein LUZ63_020693 [Rhynchospora breviuscula]|uniref:4a-hydroxytetrahydrobiopterin dehydratase n=1 Tax=Rhynchospora breviuscula TaxID=2022672 RepID=A0A9Q0C099_9POAL|nr:hypothetical protein LUZ63_020693 [Rhynchospora breviuscula]
MPDEKTVLGASDVEEAGLADWRIVFDVLHARFETGDFVTGLALVDRIGEAAEDVQHHPDLDLSYPILDVRLTSHDVGGITSRDLEMARTISGYAAEAGVAARPEAVYGLELALDTPDHEAIRDFWAALLAWDVDEDEVADPDGKRPTIWFQESDEHDTPHQRWHLDVRVPPEVVEGRVRAALDAGGTLVSDEDAPAFWVLADAQGNQACLTTWQGRGETVWGVVGDALNPFTDAIRREERLEWVGVRHEEAGAFAAGAQAQLTDDLAVCMGTVGPGAIHLLNGLYDAKKSHAPVLAIVGQVPREEMGQDFFQEVDNDKLFADVAVWTQTLASPEQLPELLEAAVNAALGERGVAVLSVPGDVGSLDVPDGTRTPTFVGPAPVGAASAAQVQAAATAIDAADRVTMLVGAGARHAREEVLALAERLNAPMVLSLKAKEGFEEDNPYEVGQSGLIGNPATTEAFAACDVLLMLGTDFPYKEFLPKGKTVVQVDTRPSHVGRRTQVSHPVVGDTRLTLQALTPMVAKKRSGKHLKAARAIYEEWGRLQARLADPKHDKKLLGRLRSKADNPEHRIRPEVVAAAVERHADDDTVFITDTGMSTVWLSRFVRMTGARRLLGSYNLGSMANAMPQGLGAQALDRRRQVVSFSGDGGLTMLMGDLITAVSHDLPVKIVVFDNGRLGMVKLEMEQAGLAEFGTVLHNPDFAKLAEAIGMKGIRVSDPGDVDGAVKEAFAHPGPVLLDVLTNPEEVSIPPKPTLEQGWGFAIAKTKEFVVSPE